MRLVDADALLSELNNLEVNCKNKYVKQGIDDGLHYYMPRILENEPTIDAVPVVRCKDCKRCYKHTTKRYKQPMWICMRLDLDRFAVRPDDFCSYGERKDGDG